MKDPKVFHNVTLVALLAWVGLGADGLSSSAYGPDEAFRALGGHTELAIFLAIATAVTVFIISYGYNRIIEQFPAGGGGYVVASKILGPRIGVVSGAALVVDYVLTIAISIASGTDAVFSFLPVAWQSIKLPVAFVALGMLTLLNLRGVKESVRAIAPVFVLFIVTHVVMLAAVFFEHTSEFGEASTRVNEGIHSSVSELGMVGALLLFLRAYSMGGGTYTGIEAVSNAMSLMREPRVQTAKRTMTLMAFSLAITAGGIIMAYLLVQAVPEHGRTMNAVLFDKVAATWNIGGFNFGKYFIMAALLSEGGLLLVAAQAGLLAGPRVMANMATDSWLPHRFAGLSERLTMRHGVKLMATAALVALLYTRGAVSTLVIMYSINVFLTFSLSNIAMIVHWYRRRGDDPAWRKSIFGHGVAAVLCLTILVVTTFEKFMEGGWLTVVVTAAFVAFCFLVKRHYRWVGAAIRRLAVDLPSPEADPAVDAHYPRQRHPVFDTEPKADDHVAVLFVGGYGALGRHALTSLLRMFPDQFKGIIFVSIAIVDSDTFKGVDEVEALERKTKESLETYVKLGRWLGFPSTSAFSVGAEVGVEAQKLAQDLVRKYPGAVFFAGQIVFEDDTAWSRLLHNETALVIQRRLQHIGTPMLVLPVLIDLRDMHSWRFSQVPGTARIVPMGGPPIKRMTPPPAAPPPATPPPAVPAEDGPK